MSKRISFTCVCGTKDADGCECSDELAMDATPEILNGELVRGLMVVNENEQATIVIPEWLARAIEEAIKSHQG